jgi:MFS family permease
VTESSTSDPGPLRVLRGLPEFRAIWLSKSISSTGSGVGRIALVLMVAPSGATSVALVLAGTALPMLLGPLAGAVADRVDQRSLLAATEAGQGVIYAALAIASGRWSPRSPGRRPTRCSPWARTCRSSSARPWAGCWPGCRASPSRSA